LPFVNALESSIEKVHFIKKISDLSGVPQNALQDDLKKIEQELKYEKEEIKDAKEALNTMYRKDYIERKLLGIILWQKTLKEQNIDVEKTLEGLTNILKISLPELLEKTTNNQEDLIFEAEVFYEEGSDIKKDIEEMMRNLEGEYLKEELERKMRELHHAEESKDKEKSIQILKECQILSEKIQNIKNGRLKKN
jgi:hypothetical protein